jgi:hypothetical protein
MLFEDIRNNSGVRYMHTWSKPLTDETVLTHLSCSTFSVLCNIQNQMFSGSCQWLALATHIKISSINSWTARFLVLSSVARWCHNFLNTNTLMYCDNVNQGRDQRHGIWPSRSQIKDSNLTLKSSTYWWPNKTTQYPVQSQRLWIQISVPHE